MKKLAATVIAWIIYVIGITALAYKGVMAYVSFQEYYGDKSYSKGFIGFMMVDFSYVIIGLIFTVILFFVHFKIHRNKIDKSDK